jgi:hypothetical protein
MGMLGRAGIMGSLDVPVIHIGMIVGKRCISIKIRPLQTRQKKKGKKILGLLLHERGNFFNAHAPPEALQSRNPSLRIRLVRIGLTNFTLSKHVNLYSSSARVEEKRNETNATRTHAPARSFSIARSTAG